MLAWYTSGRTLREIGKEFGITRERVRQLIKEVCSNGASKESRAARKAIRLSDGRVTRDEEAQLKAAYRQALREFHEEQVPLLYLGGMSMGEIARLLIGQYRAIWTQDILKRLGIDRRLRGQYERRVIPLRYPWELWADGRWHEVKQAREFDCKPECFRTRLYAKAKEKGQRVTTRMQGTIVRFCFFMLYENCPVRTESSNDPEG